MSQDGSLDIVDPIQLLLYLTGRKNPPCGSDPANTQLLDTNGDRSLDLSDAIHTLRYLFLGDGPPEGGTDCIPIAGCASACRDTP
jgi:hypothetical protein